MRSDNGPLAGLTVLGVLLLFGVVFGLGFSAFAFVYGLFVGAPARDLAIIASIFLLIFWLSFFTPSILLEGPRAWSCKKFGHVPVSPDNACWHCRRCGAGLGFGANLF
jgi:hypothetical protein